MCGLGEGNVPLKAPFPGHQGTFQRERKSWGRGLGLLLLCGKLDGPPQRCLRRKSSPKMQIFQEMV